MSNVNSIRITKEIEEAILSGHLREKTHEMIEKDSEFH
jgi:hypothetical protein